MKPGYEQRFSPDEEKRKNLRLIASRDGRSGSVTIHQDANLYVALLEAGEELVHQVLKTRYIRFQVARGSVTVNGTLLEQGDGAAVSVEDQVVVTGKGRAEVLLFDLA